MRKSLLAIITVALLSVCCARNTESESSSMPQTEDGPVWGTVIATLDVDTKTALSGQKVVWEKGDQIALSPRFYTNVVYMTLVDEDAGKSTGRFYGTYYPNYVHDAVYPASAVTGSTGDATLVNLPSVQTYRSGSFANGANISICPPFTMKEGSGPVSLVFKNTGSVLKLTFKGRGKSVSRIVVTSNKSGEFLAGSAMLDRENFESPELQFTDESDISSSVTLDCGSGVALTESGTDFYIYLPSGKLGDGFSVKVFDTGGGAMLVKAPADERNRTVKGDIKVMPPVSYSPNLPGLFLSRTATGEYSDCMTSATLATPYVTETVQTGVTKTSSELVFSRKNWNEGWVVEYRMPLNLVPNTSYDISVKPAVGNSGFTAETLHLKYLLSDNGIGWFVDEKSGKGYIFDVIL